MRWVALLLACVIGAAMISIADRLIGYRAATIGWRATTHDALFIAFGWGLAIVALVWRAP